MSFIIDLLLFYIIEIIIKFQVNITLHTIQIINTNKYNSQIISLQLLSYINHLFLV